MNTHRSTPQPTASRTRGRLMATVAAVACGACLLPSLITLGVFGAIGSAVNGAWIAAAVIASAVVAAVLLRRRTRSAAATCSADCGCSDATHIAP